LLFDHCAEHLQARMIHADAEQKHASLRLAVINGELAGRKLMISGMHF
jgi:hypothetical protein